MRCLLGVCCYLWMFFVLTSASSLEASSLVGSHVFSEDSQSVLESPLVQVADFLADGLEYQPYFLQKLIYAELGHNPRSLEAYWLLSQIYKREIIYGRNTTWNILQLFELSGDLKTLFPEHPLGDLILLEALSAVEDFEERERVEENLRLRFANYPLVAAYFCNAYAEIAPKQALEACVQGVEKASFVELRFFVQGVVKALNKFYPPDKAAQILENWAQLYHDAHFWLFAAEFYAEAGSLTQAEQAYHQALRMEPRFSYYVARGFFYFNHARYRDAFLDLRKALDQAESLPVEPLLKGELRLYLVQCLLAEKDVNAAVFEAERIFLEFPDNLQYLLSLWEMFAQYGNFDALQLVLTQARSLYPENMFFHIALAELSRRSQNTSELLEHLTNLLALGYKNTDIFVERAHLFYMQKQYNLALADLRSALELEPTNAQLYYNQACVLALLGDKELAFKNLQIAFAINASLVQFAETDKDLASLHEDALFQNLVHTARQKVVQRKE